MHAIVNIFYVLIHFYRRFECKQSKKNVIRNCFKSIHCTCVLLQWSFLSGSTNIALGTILTQLVYYGTFLYISADRTVRTCLFVHIHLLLTSRLPKKCLSCWIYTKRVDFVSFCLTEWCSVISRMGKCSTKVFNMWYTMEILRPSYYQ